MHVAKVGLCQLHLAGCCKFGTFFLSSVLSSYGHRVAGDSAGFSPANCLASVVRAARRLFKRRTLTGAVYTEFDMCILVQSLCIHCRGVRTAPTIDGRCRLHVRMRDSIRMVPQDAENRACDRSSLVCREQRCYIVLVAFCDCLRVAHTHVETARKG